MAITFEIVKHLGVLSEYRNGFRKEINIVSWNNRNGKVDIRDWDEDHQRMRKGITLTKDEFEALRNLICDIDSDSLEIE